MAERCSVEVRVRYPETDRMGIAWHGHYLAWFELGRTEWMREAGCAYGEMEDQRGLFFPVVHAEARYRASARYDDLLLVHTRLAKLGGVRVRFDYEIRDRGSERLLATGSTEHAAVDREGRPCRLPDDLKRRLEAFGATA